MSSGDLKVIREGHVLEAKCSRLGSRYCPVKSLTLCSGKGPGMHESNTEAYKETKDIRCSAALIPFFIRTGSWEGWIKDDNMS